MSTYLDIFIGQSLYDTLYILTMTDTIFHFRVGCKYFGVSVVFRWAFLGNINPVRIRDSISRLTLREFRAHRNHMIDGECIHGRVRRKRTSIVCNGVTRLWIIGRDFERVLVVRYCRGHIVLCIYIPFWYMKGNEKCLIKLLIPIIYSSILVQQKQCFMYPSSFYSLDKLCSIEN